MTFKFHTNKLNNLLRTRSNIHHKYQLKMMLYPLLFIMMAICKAFEESAISTDGLCPAGTISCSAGSNVVCYDFAKSFCAAPGLVCPIPSSVCLPGKNVPSGYGACYNFAKSFCSDGLVCPIPSSICLGSTKLKINALCYDFAKSFCAAPGLVCPIPSSICLPGTNVPNGFGACYDFAKSYCSNGLVCTRGDVICPHGPKSLTTSAVCYNPSTSYCSAGLVYNKPPGSNVP